MASTSLRMRITLVLKPTISENSWGYSSIVSTAWFSMRLTYTLPYRHLLMISLISSTFPFSYSKEGLVGRIHLRYDS